MHGSLTRTMVRSYIIYARIVTFVHAAVSINTASVVDCLVVQCNQSDVAVCANLFVLTYTTFSVGSAHTSLHTNTTNLKMEESVSFIIYNIAE